ncbi:MAG: hypothetical protein AB7S65_06070 [Sulfuricurvum sp.]
MDSQSLKRIVESLVGHMGEKGARDYICSGDYSPELKARAVSIIDMNDAESRKNAMVIESDLHDIESSWRSESRWSYFHAS